MASDELRIRLLPGDNSAVVSAPHGHDYWTAEIVRAICDTTGLCGITVQHMEDPGDDLRVNVNRPTEGAGRSPDEEIPTIGAARAYAEYLGAVVQVCHGRLDLYVEVHGNETQSHAEVATVGLPDEHREVLREALADIPGGVLVEGLDHIEKSGSAAKQHGILRVVPRGVQIELPMGARATPEARAISAYVIARGVLALLTLRTGPTLSRLFRAG